MREIKTDRYGPAAKALIDRARQEGRPKTLFFAAPAEAARADLHALTDATISKDKKVRMPHDAECLKSALWLLYDFMPESHGVSQKVATPSGSYWHAILHRREVDTGAREGGLPPRDNARYWFSRVGEHPIFSELIRDAREIAGAQPPEALKELVTHDAWDPDVMVKLCTSPQDGETTRLLLEIQRREWEILFDHNFEKAFAR
ncbi:MAG: hypothetical protein KIS92_24005 [Planctomycetota bacterium]|nr:hypothetical protein [Planctomycetota bacterium]